MRCTKKLVLAKNFSIVGNGNGYVRTLIAAPSGTEVAVGIYQGEVLEYNLRIESDVTGR